MVKLISADAEEDITKNELPLQAFSFFLHCLFALAAWGVMMLAGYAINPSSVPQITVLILSALVPLIVGYIIARTRPTEMAPHIWLAGLIWLLVMALWITDLPTGPNACLDCSATEKLSRTLFSIPTPSGLLDDNGPFFATWPAAAMIGYAVGARLALRRSRQAEEE